MPSDDQARWRAMRIEAVRAGVFIVACLVAGAAAALARWVWPEVWAAAAGALGFLLGVLYSEAGRSFIYQNDP